MDDELTEEELYDGILWEVDNIDPSDGYPEMDKNQLHKERSRYERLRETISKQMDKQTDMKPQWNRLRKRVGRKMTLIYAALRERNLEKRTQVTDTKLGDRIISAVIGMLREAGWTVTPPANRPWEGKDEA